MRLIEAKETLRKLDFNKKMQFFEELWEDLVREYESQSVPQEHVQTIQERYAKYQNGEAASDNWENVKKRILNAE